MIIKFFAWLKNITKIEQEIIDDPFVIDINTLKKHLTKKQNMKYLLMVAVQKRRLD